jgi:hypothetical protein
MGETENYRTKQAFLVVAVFGLLALAFVGGSWMASVGLVLAATAVAIYASTTQPARPHDDHGHHH